MLFAGLSEMPVKEARRFVDQVDLKATKLIDDPPSLNRLFEFANTFSLQSTKRERRTAWSESGDARSITDAFHLGEF